METRTSHENEFVVGKEMAIKLSHAWKKIVQLADPCAALWSLKKTTKQLA